LILGAALLVARFVMRRSWRDLLLLLFVPILLLPSTLSLAFPNENPSVVRAGGAIAVVYIIVALPLALVIRYFQRKFAGSGWKFAGWIATGLIVAVSAQVNYQMYFVDYPAQYIGSSMNSSEIGQVVHDFAQSFGSYDTAYLMGYPYWADDRSVGIYAGKLGWEQTNAFPPAAYDRLLQMAADPRPKLFITHRDDAEAMSVLQQNYPAGSLSRYHSARLDHDFLIYYVPGVSETVEPPLE